MDNKDLQVLRKIYDHIKSIIICRGINKRILIISVCILFGLSTLCSCSSANTQTSNSMNSNSVNDNDIRYIMDRSAELKNITLKYSKYWKKDQIDGVNYEHYFFRLSVPESNIFVTTEEPDTNSENPAKSYAEIHSKIDKESEVVSFEEVRVDDKLGYKVLTRCYDDISNSYDKDSYNVFIVFEYKDILYCINMDYSKEEKDIGNIVLEDFLNAIELH